MADRYWFGDGGNWSDTAHWGTASNGVGAPAAVPGIGDNVYFDINSFTIGAQQVNVNISGSYCLDMDWTGATNSPQLMGDYGVRMYGDLTLIAAMSVTTPAFYFDNTAGNWTVTTNGLSIGASLYFRGLGGTWTLQDNVTTTQYFRLDKGTVDTNGQTITCASFVIAFADVKVLTLGNSTINCTAWNNAGTNLTLTANTATINVSGTGVFTGGSIATYNITKLNGTEHLVSGDNTFAKLTFNPSGAQTITFTDGTTQTVGLFTRSGSGIITFVGTGAAGWNLVKTGGNHVELYSMSISYSMVSPLSTWYAGKKSVDGGNNSGWIFGERTLLNILLSSGFIRGK